MRISVHVAAIFLVGLLLSSPVACADDEEKPATARDISAEFSDPLTTLPQIFLQDAYTPVNDGSEAQSNRALARIIIPRVPSTSLLPFVQLIRPTFSVVTAPVGQGKDTRTGFGDIQLIDLAVIPWPSRESGLLMALGPVFNFPTATVKEAGQSSWQAGLAFGTIYKGIPRVILGCLIQNPISFAYTSEAKKSINNLLVQPIVMAYIGEGFYVKSADATWTFGWEDGSAKLIPVSLGLGYVLLKEGWSPINLFVSGEHTFYRENAKISPDTTVRFGMTVAFPQWRPW